MVHNFKDKNIGVGITGSYCTYKKVFEQLKRLADKIGRASCRERV